jgi:two-component system chemotaxis sensor kinase CheA
MSGLDELRVSFFQECEDLLDSLSDGLREMSDSADSELGDDTMETVHAVFRAVHSIKGGAGAFGLETLVTFAHLFETVLDQMRDGKMPVSSDAMRILLRAGDMLSDLVFCARDGRDPDSERMDQLLAELDALADGAGEDDDDEPFEFVPTGVGIGPLDLPDFDGPGDIDLPPLGSEEGPCSYDIRLKPHGALYETGNDALALIRALSRLGDLTIFTDVEPIEALEAFDPSNPQLAWHLGLATDQPRSEIDAVFEFVADVADITVTEAVDDAHAVADVDTAGTPSGETGKLLRNAPADTPDAPDTPKAEAAPPAQGPSEQQKADAPTTSDAPARADTPTAAAAAAPAPPREGKSQNEAPVSAAAPQTIRVNLDRVDRLINLIGELVIMEAMLAQAVETAGLDGNSDVSNGLDGIKQLASGIQESVMAIRAQPLKPVFQRMHRIIREAGDATGKQVRFVTTGENTEVDKTVIERLVDPLTHMIRNSVDHGLEDGATRLAAGKSETGTITLSAVHRSGRVIIEVSDDGGGINREKVRQIAEAKGLVPVGATLSPSEIDNLLFMPGFSSKEEVSALSGRGVGLDVVRREIQALGGRVTIQSNAGEGTTFSIALPLTLAVLEGMLVEFGGEMMVLPLSAILETLRPSSATIHSIGRTGRVVANRGELIPIIDLAEVFGVAGPNDNGERDVLLLVESEAGRRAALAVDLIHDQRQVVIKSLEENYGAIPGISAATILGDGRIALIVDPEEIIASSSPETTAPPIAANE